VPGRDGAARALRPERGAQREAQGAAFAAPDRRDEVATHSVAGQYSAGAVDGVAVPGYRDELGRASDTETFVALRAHIDNWRWSGVPFYLRTGKRMPRRCTEIYLQFRAVPHSIFKGTGAHADPNALLIRLQPEERIELHLMHKTPGLDRSGLKLSRVALDLDVHEAFRANRGAASPTNACTWTRSKAMARCSCVATKPKPRGNGSTASSTAGARRASRPSRIRPAPGARAARSR
jgi:hypothetical protein